MLRHCMGSLLRTVAFCAYDGKRKLAQRNHEALAMPVVGSGL